MIIKALAATSAALAAQLSDETGTGVVAFATSPALVTPIITGPLEVRNGANPQTARLYETYTDASNYSRLSISAPTGGPITVASEAAGTGTARSLKINYGGSSTAAITVSDSATGLVTLGGKTNFSTFCAIQSYGGNTDIPSGALVGSLGSSSFSFFPSVDNVAAGAKLVFGYWNGGGRSAVEVANVSSGDGTLLLMKSGGLVAVGGLTSSFPAIKRSSAILQARLADDSAFCQVQGKLTTDANAVTGLTAGVLSATTNATITVTDASGQVYRVPCII